MVFNVSGSHNTYLYPNKIHSKIDIMTFAGSLKISDAEAEEMKNTIKLLRKKSTGEIKL